MSSPGTLIKWPGGKTREIKQIEYLIPEFDRYVEPFFGGGAMFFHVRPEHALINDVSKELTDFYALVKAQDADFKQYLLAYASLWGDLLLLCDRQYDQILALYEKMEHKQQGSLPSDIRTLVDSVAGQLPSSETKLLLLDGEAYRTRLCRSVWDKFCRTQKNEEKAPFNDEDLKENLITGFTSGTYLYFRDVYNDILLERGEAVSTACRVANYYFIREYCYGSMFRYNVKGEFNIPYGGMSYNRKDFRAKIREIFSEDTKQLFQGTEIHCKDFEEFFSSCELKETDFMFLDPPYDTDFSDYEGRAFTQEDQRRLAEALKKTKAGFILVIKNTDFIYSLYEHDFHILCFDKTYTYNVRSRNERKVEHLIITNLPV